MIVEKELENEEAAEQQDIEQYREWRNKEEIKSSNDLKFYKRTERKVVRRWTFNFNWK